MITICHSHYDKAPEMTSSKTNRHMQQFLVKLVALKCLISEVQTNGILYYLKSWE